MTANRGALVRVAAVAVFLAATSGCKASAYYSAAEKTRPRNPHAAIEYLAKCLEVDPTNQKAIDLADEIGKTIASEHGAKVRELEASGNFAEAIAQCDRVSATQALLKAMPGGVTIATDDTLRGRLCQKAAEKFYNDGVALEATNARSAAIAFRSANGFVPNYKDAKKRYAANLERGTTKLAFGTFQARTPQEQHLVNQLTSKVKGLVSQEKAEFLKVLSPDKESEATARLVGTIEGSFEDTNWQGEPGENEETRERQKKDGSGRLMYETQTEQVGVNPDGSPIYQEKQVPIMEQYTIRARWTVYTRTTKLDLSVAFEVQDAKSGAVLANGEARGSANDSKTYVSDIQGDKDAVPYRIQNLPKGRQDPANREQLGRLCVDQPVKPIADKIAALGKGSGN